MSLIAIQISSISNSINMSRQRQEHIFTCSESECEGAHRTVRAFSMVSAVVKVLETTTINVVSGLRPFRARATSTGSTLARKRRFLPFAYACTATSAWSMPGAYACCLAG